VGQAWVKLWVKQMKENRAQCLAQDGVQAKLTALWIGRCLKQLPPPAKRKAA